MGRRIGLFLDTPLLLRRIATESQDPGDGDADIYTGLLNLFELVHVLIREGHPRTAEAAFDRFSPLAEGLSRRRIFEASRLRGRLPDRGLSYADAAGYVTARELDATFVTMDRAFKGLPGARVVPR